MNNFLKIIGYVILGILAFSVAIWVIKTTVGLVLGILYALIPIAILGGVAYLIYNAVQKKSLGGGGRSLP